MLTIFPCVCIMFIQGGVGWGGRGGLCHTKRNLIFQRFNQVKFKFRVHAVLRRILDLFDSKLLYEKGKDFLDILQTIRTINVLILSRPFMYAINTVQLCCFVNCIKVDIYKWTRILGNAVCPGCFVQFSQFAHYIQWTRLLVKH